MTDEPDRYPGYDHDINPGVPLTLGALVASVRNGIGLSAAAGFEHDGPGQMGTDPFEREVFVRARDVDGLHYWVTGVRLLADEPGSSSLAGAIELVVEDGDGAQQRHHATAMRAKADRLIDFLAVRLAHIAKGQPFQNVGVGNGEVDPYRAMAAALLRRLGPDLEIDPELAEYL